MANDGYYLKTDEFSPLANQEPSIIWMPDGSYKYGQPIEEMLKSKVSLVRNFAICIRDAYEAGLRGDKIPMQGKP